MIKRHTRFLMFSLLGLLACSAVFCMGSGSCEIPMARVAAVISSTVAGIPGPDTLSPLERTIVWEIRLPRLLVALATGICLAVSGAVFQGCFRNPLVEPYILGISSGAAFGAALGIVFPAFFMSVQILAFGFGGLAVALSWSMARTRGETPVAALVLSGIITGSIFGSLVGMIKYLAADTALREIVFWLMGGFYYAGWADAGLMLPIAGGGLALTWAMAWRINVLSMGDTQARSLGINPEPNKLFLIVLATLMTAAAVSCSGVIAWVGLMIPHAARMVVGPDHRVVIPVSALLGALYLLACDTLARTLTSAEIPIGIMTSLVGGPYLFFLIRTRGRRGLGG
ncbi:MAG: iron ABC transporter permease [Desulfobacterales bacterium]|nr:iron ABC transporter permease [Desulfobacterales bacterium]